MKTLYVKTSSLIAGLTFGLLCCLSPVISTAAPGGAPANDECSGAVAVTCGSTTSGTTVGATTDNDAVGCGNNASISSPGVWYTIVGDGSDMTASLCSNAAFDTKISVFTGSCGSYVCVDGNDDACGVQSEVAWSSIPGTTYYILVHAFGGATGTFDLVVSCAPPANDACSGAVALACGDVVAGSTAAATETEEPACWTDPIYTDPGLWYSFVGDGTDYTVSLTSQTGDPVLAITSDCSNGASCDAFNDDANGFDSEISGFTTTNGTTYYIYVSGYGALDDFELSISSPTCEPPANDLCVDAETIQCGDVVSGTTTNATTDPQITQDCDGNSTGNGAWYVLAGNGKDVTVSTCSANTTFDTEINVYSGACGSLSCEGFNDDDNGCSFSTLRSTATFYAEPGVDYYVRVSYWSSSNSASGDFELSVTCACPSLDAGTLTADENPVCLDGTTTISATQGTAPTVPAGFAVAYVLTDGDSPNLDILDVSAPPSAVPSFDVTAGGNYIIHTLVFDPADASTILAETTGVGVAGLFEAGGGSLCGSLDVTGTGSIIVNAPEVGATVADASSVCLDGGSAAIGAESDGNEVVPPGFTLVYVLTDADNNLEILDANATGDFTVTAGGNYIIHTFVYNPAEVTDLTPFVGQSATVVVDAINNGVCAALDVAGAPIAVNAPEVGATIADASSVCLVDGSAEIGGEADGNEVVPAGFTLVYVLTDADNNLEILDANATGDFTVTTGGNYIIHTFVYDPTEVTDLTPFVGQSATIVVDAINNGVCAALDVAGTGSILVEGPTAGTLSAVETPVCLVGGSADIAAVEGDAPTVPTDYQVLYVLTEGAGLVIVDAGATPDFTVTAEGDYTIHTLVYNPATLDLNGVVFGTTTGFDVNGLLVQGGGSICGALDVTGAPITVEDCTPANDLCADAEVIGCGDVVSGDFLFATADNAASDCGNTVGPGVWYVFTGTGDQVTVSTCGSNADTEISVYEGDCNSLVCVDFNDDECGIQSSVTFLSVQGTDYYINVAYWSGSTLPTVGDFDLTVACASPPTNNEACGSEALSLGANGPYTHSSFYDAAAWETSFTVPTVGCTEQGGWCINVDIENSAWYSFVAPASGNVSISSDGSSFDTQLAVFSGSCQDVEGGNGVLLGANDDDPDASGSGGSTLTSNVLLCGLTGGETYYVLVDGWGGATGDLTLTITEIGPSADFTSSATNLAVDFTDASTASGTIVSWAWDFDDASATSTDQNPSYTFTAAGTYNVCLTVTDDAGCSSTYCEDVMVTDIPTSIAEAVEHGLEVYPNPSNGQFVVTIRGVEAPVQLTVIDVAGRAVYTEGAVLSGNYRKELNLNVASGSYLLQVITDEGLVTRKILVQ